MRVDRGVRVEEAQDGADVAALWNGGDAGVVVPGGLAATSDEYN